MPPAFRCCGRLPHSEALGQDGESSPEHSWMQEANLRLHGLTSAATAYGHWCFHITAVLACEAFINFIARFVA